MPFEWQCHTENELEQRPQYKNRPGIKQSYMIIPTDVAKYYYCHSKGTVSINIFEHNYSWLWERASTTCHFLAIDRGNKHKFNQKSHEQFPTKIEKTCFQKISQRNYLLKARSNFRFSFTVASHSKTKSVQPITKKLRGATFPIETIIKSRIHQTQYKSVEGSGIVLLSQKGGLLRLCIDYRA